MKGWLDLDAIDKKIVGKLKENSRLTWKELGEEVHMTGQAVGARVERLIEGKKIRRFTVEVAYDETAFITMYMGSQNDGIFENEWPPILMSNRCTRFPETDVIC